MNNKLVVCSMCVDGLRANITCDYCGGKGRVPDPASTLKQSQSAPSKTTLNDLVEIFGAMSDSEFARAASGEHGEDLLSAIVGAARRGLDEIARLEATDISRAEAVLPIMCQAFRTTVIEGGKCTMRFAFSDHDKMCQADREWHAFRAALATAGKEQSEPECEKHGTPFILPGVCAWCDEPNQRLDELTRMTEEIGGYEAQRKAVSSGPDPRKAVSTKCVGCGKSLTIPADVFETEPKGFNCGGCYLMGSPQ